MAMTNYREALLYMSPGTPAQTSFTFEKFQPRAHKNNYDLAKIKEPIPQKCYTQCCFTEEHNNSTKKPHQI